MSSSRLPPFFPSPDGWIFITVSSSLMLVFHLGSNRGLSPFISFTVLFFNCLSICCLKRANRRKLASCCTVQLNNRARARVCVCVCVCVCVYLFSRTAMAVNPVSDFCCLLFSSPAALWRYVSPWTARTNRSGQSSWKKVTNVSRLLGTIQPGFLLDWRQNVNPRVFLAKMFVI